MQDAANHAGMLACDSQFRTRDHTKTTDCLRSHMRRSRVLVGRLKHMTLLGISQFDVPAGRCPVSEVISLNGDVTAVGLVMNRDE